jgi:hypothetical protein
LSNVFSILGFVEQLREIEHDMKEVEAAIVRQACIMVATEAKRVIGTYDYGWPSLAESTLAKKAADTPLLETGEMRDSIEWNAHGNEGHVGSNNDKAVWQELGTSRIPPRSFLAGALHHEAPEIVKMAGKAVHAVVAGKGMHSPELEFLHLLRHIGHEVNEVLQKVLDGPDDENKGRRR